MRQPQAKEAARPELRRTTARVSSCMEGGSQGTAAALHKMQERGGSGWHAGGRLILVHTGRRQRRRQDDRYQPRAAVRERFLPTALDDAKPRWGDAGPNALRDRHAFAKSALGGYISHGYLLTDNAVASLAARGELRVTLKR